MALQLRLLGRTEVCFDLAFGFGDSLYQKPHVLLCIFNTVKRGLKRTIQSRVPHKILLLPV